MGIQGNVADGLGVAGRDDTAALARLQGEELGEETAGEQDRAAGLARVGRADDSPGVGGESVYQAVEVGGQEVGLVRQGEEEARGSPFRGFDTRANRPSLWLSS